MWGWCDRECDQATCKVLITLHLHHAIPCLLSRRSAIQRLPAAQGVPETPPRQVGPKGWGGGAKGTEAGVTPEKFSKKLLKKVSLNGTCPQ
jgi:hypothetical protein